MATTKKPTQDDQKWDDAVTSGSSSPHYMQSSTWGKTKGGSAWPITHLHVEHGKGTYPLQVFSRSVPGLGKLHYAPEAAAIEPAFVPELTKHIKSSYRRGLAIKFELYQPHNNKLIAAFKAAGWRAGNSVQPRTTVIVNLKGTPDELFASYKKRARYEMRVGERNGVRVEKAAPTRENFDKLSTLIRTTGQRSGAFFRSEAYFHNYWQAFTAANQGRLYFAWHEKDLLAGAFIIEYGKTAWYKDGGSVREKSELMASRYLQWHIMRDMQAKGLLFYDLSGIPAKHEAEQSSMKGLYVFKTGFSDETTTLMPAMELPLGRRYPLWPRSETQFLRAYSGFKHDFWY